MNSESCETISWAVDEDGVALLTLDRPEALNAFNLTMARELLDFWTGPARSDDVRAVVLTGSGRAFCAGMDLSADGNVFGLDESLAPAYADLAEHLADPSVHPEYADGVRDTGGKISLAVHALAKPTMAAINGAAVGIGATMTLPMDLRLASTSARIGFVFGRLGIVPEAASSYFLPRIVGVSKALEWVYAADILSAEQALEGRLVRSVHEPEGLVPAALELARSFVRGRSSVALGLAKQLIHHNLSAADPLEAHLTDSLAMFWTSVGDGREGVAAFKEKRSAQFQSTTSQLPAVF
ncbi:MAG: enoyl-CoA hydratase-related protein [Nocardioides sp.]